MVYNKDITSEEKLLPGAEMLLTYLYPIDLVLKDEGFVCIEQNGTCGVYKLFPYLYSQQRNTENHYK